MAAIQGTSGIGPTMTVIPDHPIEHASKVVIDRLSKIITTLSKKGPLSRKIYREIRKKYPIKKYTEEFKQISVAKQTICELIINSVEGKLKDENREFQKINELLTTGNLLLNTAWRHSKLQIFPLTDESFSKGVIGNITLGLVMECLGNQESKSAKPEEKKA